MNEIPVTEVNYNLVGVRLEKARANAQKCFICMRIAEAPGAHQVDVKPINISGIELTPEIQIDHLSRCVGR